jgi:hypothetical protein
LCRVPLEPETTEFGNSVDQSAFSWSLETWQLNTASLAHIQCSSGRITMDSYLAEDCRFVDQPLPDDSVSLVQLRGNWTAAPGLNLGLGAFHSQPDSSSSIPFRPGAAMDYRADNPLATTSQPYSAEGLDFNMSFGIQTERVGDFLIGLQLARYRQRMSLTDLGLPMDHWITSADTSVTSQYSNSAAVDAGLAPRQLQRRNDSATIVNRRCG